MFALLFSLQLCLLRSFRSLAVPCTHTLARTVAQAETHALLPTPCHCRPQTESPAVADATTRLLQLLRSAPVDALPAEAASGVVWAAGTLARRFVDAEQQLPLDLAEEVGPQAWTGRYQAFCLQCPGSTPRRAFRPAWIHWCTESPQQTLRSSNPAGQVSHYVAGLDAASADASGPEPLPGWAASHIAVALLGLARLGRVPPRFLAASEARLIDADLVGGIPLRDLSMIAWSLGTLRCGSAAVCDALAREAVERLEAIIDEGARPAGEGHG